MMKFLSIGEKAVVQTELNDHMGEDNYYTEKMHGQHRYRRANRGEKRVVKLTALFNFMIAST